MTLLHLEESSSMEQAKLLTIASVIFAIASLGLGAASIAIFAQRPDVTTTQGRLLVAGALANLSLAILMAIIAIFALRQGEKWAFWALCLPFALYGLPILFLDVTNVKSQELLSTLAPQVLGLLLALLGLFLAARAIFK